MLQRADLVEGDEINMRRRKEAKYKDALGEGNRSPNSILNRLLAWRGEKPDS
jgi:hypothetical protein